MKKQETKGKEEKGKEEKGKTRSLPYSKKVMVLIIIIAVAILAYAIYAAYQLLTHPTDIFTIEEGKVSLEEQAEGCVIREEQTIQGQNYKNGMVQIKGEGERVAKDESVFRYYSSGEEELIKKIQELDEKIDEAKSKEDVTIFSSDIKLLDKDIDSRLNEIYNTNNIQKIAEYKKEISKAITKKTNIVGEKSPAGSYMKKLIDERSSYENKLNSGSEYVKAPISGMASYRVDGLENVLTPDKFSTFNRTFFEGLNLKTGQIIASNNESGKIVNNYWCYIATIIKRDQTHEIKQGGSLKLRFSNTEEIPATIEFLQEQENDDVLVIFKIKKDVEELVNYRKVSFDIVFWSFSGLKVPNTSIIEEGDLSYVIRNRAGYQDKVLVKVKRKNDTYSIIGNYDTEELKDLGFDSATIRSNKNIGIYDEVLTNANSSNIK